MLSTADELAEKTLAFWYTSKVFHSGEGPSMTMSQAIDRCNKAFEVLGPHRPLKHRLFVLQDRLIQGRGKRRKTPIEPNNVRQLFG